jgi:hypothetical protein
LDRKQDFLENEILGKHLLEEKSRLEEDIKIAVKKMGYRNMSWSKVMFTVKPSFS